MRLTNIFVVFASVGGVFCASVSPRQLLPAAGALPDGAPQFQKTMPVQRLVQADGFVQTTRDEGYKRTCTIKIPLDRPSADPQKCDGATWQFRVTSWDNSSHWSYAVDHALQDGQGKVWVKTSGGDVARSPEDYPAGTQDWSFAFVDVAVALAGWIGDKYPKPQSS